MKFRLFIYLLFCIFPLPAQQTVQIGELEKARLVTLAEIEEINQWLKENIQTTTNALTRLDLLTRQISSRKKVVQLLDQEIISINKEINSKETDIKTLEKDFETKKQQYAVSVRKIYFHKNNQDNLLFILSSKNFTQSYNRIMYLKTFSNWQKKQAGEIIERQNTISREKDLLVAHRNNKLNLLKERRSEENQLSIEETERKAEVQSLEKNKKKLQEDLADKEKQASALNRQIERIIAEEVLKSEKAAKSESGEIRTTEVNGGYAMTESERNLSSTFAGNKGKLPFPVNGNYRIVGYFGIHQHKELSKITTNNNGIDIETSAGSEAKAVFNGVVSRIFTLPGYNNSIIVRHGNYLTLYSNIDQVYVKQGDKVNTGQPVGKIYTDREKGNSAMLHFEIWKEQTKQDPLIWIKK